MAFDLTTYVTTAISYTNGSPHIGHAYEVIAADVFARATRLSNVDVRLVTGTDEHGAKVQARAQQLGIDPKTYVDGIARQFKDMNLDANILYGRFIRTTDDDHADVVRHVWQKLKDVDALYLDSYKGWYSVADEAYVDEKDTIERDGSRYTQEGREVKWVEEPCWFFRLSDYETEVRQFIETSVEPEFRRKEMLELIKDGLRDLAVTRTTFDWGIEVEEGHVAYVWLDALFNYYTAAQGARNYWPPDLQIVGKDILKFHAIYWPAFLAALEYNQPRKIFAHGFLLNNGERMAKSTGNVVDPIAMCRKYGPARLRYYLLQLCKFGSDGDFSEEKLVEVSNTDLANNWGNCVSRLLSIAAKRGEWPTVVNERYVTGAEEKFNPFEVLSKFRQLDFHGGIMHWRGMVSDLNAYVSENRVWEEGKEEELGNALWTLRRLNEVIEPVMPEVSTQVEDLFTDAVPTKPEPLFQRLTFEEDR